MDDKGKPETLYLHGRSSVSHFCILFLFFFADDIKPLFKYRYFIKRHVIPLEKQGLHIQKNQFDYWLNELTDFKILGSIKVNMNYSIT